MTGTAEEPGVDAREERRALQSRTVVLGLVAAAWLVAGWHTGWAAVGDLLDRLSDTFFAWPFTTPAYSAEEAQDDALRFTLTATGIPLVRSALALVLARPGGRSVRHGRRPRAGDRPGPVRARDPGRAGGRPLRRPAAGLPGAQRRRHPLPRRLSAPRLGQASRSRSAGETRPVR